MHDLSIPPGQHLNPFSDDFRGKWNDAAAAAEALYNPQVDSQGQFDLIPGNALNYTQNPYDAPDSTGAIAQGPRVLAKITGENSAGVYTATQAVWDDSASEYIDLASGYTWDSGGSDQGDLYSRQGIAGLPTGVVVEALLEIGDDGEVRWVCESFGAMIPVNLAIASGSNGTYNTDPPTWTYTMTDKHGQVLGTSAPENGRDECEYTSATRGYAYLTNAGTWSLGWANEEIDLPALAASDHYGFYVASATTGGDARAEADTVGGQNIDNNPAPPSTGEPKYRQPVRQTCDNDWLGVKTYAEDDGGGDTFLTQWINFSEYKAECLPLTGKFLGWAGGTWTPLVPPDTDTQGYEFVDYNDVNVGTEPDNGRINFKDSAVTPTSGSQEVNWTITNDAGNDTVDVEGEVDIDAWLKALGTYAAGKKQVLVNDNGTIKWVDTAECP